MERSSKNYLPVFLLCALLWVRPWGMNEARAEIPAKLKVMMQLSLYGTAGGALLGTASMAFGMGPRAIFQGASIGLYAGILFGGYVLYSHSQNPQKEAMGEGEYSAGGGRGGNNRNTSSQTVVDSYGYRWNPYEHSARLGNVRRDWGRSREKGKSIPLYLNIFHYQF